MRERLISSLLSEEHMQDGDWAEGEEEEDWGPEDSTKTLSSFLGTGQWRGQRESYCRPDDFHWTNCSYFITSLSTRWPALLSADRPQLQTCPSQGWPLSATLPHYVEPTSWRSPLEILTYQAAHSQFVYYKPVDRGFGGFGRTALATQRSAWSLQKLLYWLLLTPQIAVTSVEDCSNTASFLVACTVRE